MPPRTTHLFAILSFLVEMTVSSPVYNMQPTYITATIGSTGRNIRNLPCISRKNNQSGVCMFAIDCLKANGTHLGTCIDRFYFGSCCHIEPLQDITENTIDAALIPSREPPHRIASVTTTTTKASTTTTKATSTIRPQISTTSKRTTITSSTLPVATAQTAESAKNASSFETTAPPATSLSSPVSPTQEDIESFKITTFQTVEDVKPTTVSTTTTSTTTQSTTTKRKPVKTKPPTYKPLPTLSSSVGTKVTTKVTKPRPQTTPKPKPVQSVSTHSTATHPIRLNATITRPRPKPTKPVKITKPIASNATTTFATTAKTPSAQTTPRTTTTTPSTVKTTKLTKKPSIITKGTLATRRPIITAPSRLPVNVTAATMPSTTLSNELHADANQTLDKEKPALVNGNPATNEIESVSSAKPIPDATTSAENLVTWSEINKNTSTILNATTAAPSVTSSTSTTVEATNPDDWVPITDGWVLLPSLTTTSEPDMTTIPSSTPKSEVVLSSTEETSSSESSQSSLSTEESLSSSSSTEKSSEITTWTSTSISSTSSSTESTSQSSSTSVEDASVSSSTEEGSSTLAPLLATSGINMSDFTDVCGRRMVPEGRIVGGEKSSFGKWPWQISLRQWRTSTYLHKCGAALLNENWAITAAHCVDNVPPSDLLLRLGEHDLSTEAEPYLHQERRVQIVASHPQFDPRTFEYDLALLRFYEPVTFQPNIIPVCVPQNDENFVGRNAHVTGWGRLYEDGPLPSVLQEVSVPVINNTVCESMYRSAGYIEHIPNIFICAGWRRGGFDSCEGDSGGPMVIQRSDKRFLLAGVISWGIGCAEPNQPGVYTRISEFRDWINQILQF